MKPKFTQSELESAVRTSQSVRQTLATLNLVGAGGNYATIRRYCEKWNIDTSHFTGQAHNRGKSRRVGNYSGQKRIPLDELLVEHPKWFVSSHKLKLRLIEDGIFVHKCYRCENTEWLGVPIALELEHRNGKNTDNRLENLTLLCPNCHAQTPTYRGKNKRKVP